MKYRRCSTPCNCFRASLCALGPLACFRAFLLNYLALVAGALPLAFAWPRRTSLHSRFSGFTHHRWFEAYLPIADRCASKTCDIPHMCIICFLQEAESSWPMHTFASQQREMLRGSAVQLAHLSSVAPQSLHHSTGGAGLFVQHLASLCTLLNYSAFEAGALHFALLHRGGPRFTVVSVPFMHHRWFEAYLPVECYGNGVCGSCRLVCSCVLPYGGPCYVL